LILRTTLSAFGKRIKTPDRKERYLSLNDKFQQTLTLFVSAIVDTFKHIKRSLTI
jgi:hypothetical protein